MRLEPTDFIPDVECPYCNQGFDIESTIEDSREDCYGPVKCLECGKGFIIETYVTFVVIK